MKKLWALVLAVGVVACASAVRRSSSGGAAPGDEIQSRFIKTTTGTVESYTADQNIVVRETDGAEVSLPLDAGARVDDEIATGQTVTVAWLTDSLGRPRVTSIAPFSEAKVTGGSASSAPPSKAYASATDGGAMSATPAGPLAGTPRAPVTAPSATPSYPVQPTPPAPSR